jgi:hypothetical protein
VPNYFAGDIAVKKTHGQKGECNMGKAAKPSPQLGTGVSQQVTEDATP